MQKLHFSDPAPLLQLITQYMDGPLRYANFLLHFPKSCKMTVIRILVVDQASIVWETIVEDLFSLIELNILLKKILALNIKKLPNETSKAAILAFYVSN